MADELPIVGVMACGHWPFVECNPERWDDDGKWTCLRIVAEGGSIERWPIERVRSTHAHARGECPADFASFPICPPSSSSVGVPDA